MFSVPPFSVLSASPHMPAIHDDILSDPRYPVHKIAGQLRPYLEVLVEQFHPERVILFGSYAYGEPDQHSDVDLLIVRNSAPYSDSMAAAKVIRHAWWPVRRTGANLSIESIVESPEGHRERLKKGGAFYEEINRRGLVLV